MTTKTLVSLPVLLVMFTLSVCAKAQAEQSSDSVVEAAETYFKAMKQKEYPLIWKSLTAKSQATIVTDVSKRAGRTYSNEQVRNDFSAGGLISRSYWEEYLFYFDPDTVLQESTWEMGSSGKEQSDILLRHKKSEQPARLKMFKEEGQWKVGLIETFGTERRDKPRW